MEEERNYWQEIGLRRLSRRRLLQAGALGGVGLWAASQLGCNTGTQTPSASKTLDRVVIAVGEEPPSFDPHKANGGLYAQITDNLYGGLLNRDNANKAVPDLATSWSVLDGGLTYEFKLRQGVKFHNGDPFTAKDVEHSFKRFTDPKIYPNTTNIKHWKSCEVVDDYTVRIHLSEVDVTFLGFLSSSYRFRIVPKDYILKVGDDGFEKAPVGTGPYKFVTRTIKESWELAAFDDYWGGKPALQHAIYKVIPEPTTMAAALKTGEVDLVGSYPPLFIDELSKTPGYRWKKNLGSTGILVKINCVKKTDTATGKPSPYLDKRVRQAMNYAVDKDALVSKILNGFGEVADVLYPDDFGYDPSVKPYPYDPKKAKDLMAEAGYANGFDATYWGLANGRVPMSEEIDLAVANYFTAIGIRTKVVNQEYALYLRRATKGSDLEFYPFGIGLSFAAGGFHPVDGFRTKATCAGANSFYCNPDFETMYKKMVSEPDEAKEEALIKQAVKFLHEEAHYVYLYRVAIAYAMKDWLDYTPKVNSEYVQAANIRAAK